MIKICHVTSAHGSFDGRIFRRACVSSALAGYDTYIVQRGEDGEEDGIHVIGLGEPERSDRVYRITAFAHKAYKKALQVDADIYQLHDPELLPYAIKLKKKGKRVVFDSHENYVEQFAVKPYIHGNVSKLLSRWYKWYSERIIRKIDGITYPVDDEYYRSIARIVPHSSVTNNVPWLSETYDEYNSSKEHEDNVVCYAGGCDKARGIEQMVKGCYKANVKLYLAGKFTSDEYRRHVEQMPEYSCVKYFGLLDHDKVVELYQKSSIGLCLLLDEGQYYKAQNLATKVYEYMAMGLPVIASDSEYNKRIFSELDIGLCVNPMDTDSVASSISSLIRDKKRCKTMGENGRKAIKKRFNWDKEQYNLLKLYQEILDE